MIPKKLKNLSFEIIDITTFNRINAEVYVEDLLKRYGYNLKRKMEKGHPDFIVYKNNKILFYVEVKTNDDGLKKEQVEWIINNPDKEVIVFYVGQDMEEKKVKKLHQKEQKEKQEFEELKKLVLKDIKDL